jgi:hypothetical protein
VKALEVLHAIYKTRSSPNQGITLLVGLLLTEQYGSNTYCMQQDRATCWYDVRNQIQTHFGSLYANKASSRANLFSTHENGNIYIYSTLWTASCLGNKDIAEQGLRT